MHGLSASDPIALDGNAVDEGTQMHGISASVPLLSKALIRGLSTLTTTIR